MSLAAKENCCSCFSQRRRVQRLESKFTTPWLVVAPSWPIKHHLLPARSFTNINNQMLLYIRVEGGVGKSRVVKAIEMGFGLLHRREELMITAPTGAAASKIGGNMHVSMSIKPPGRNVSLLSTAWTQRTALIVDEVRMIRLKLLASMDSRIWKAKGVPVNFEAWFRGLSHVVLMDDYFQFAPVGGKALWIGKKMYSRWRKRENIVV